MTKSEKPKRIRKDRSNILTLSERHVISENHPFFEECAYLCHLSKNLYNATLYVQRQWFFAGSFKSYPVVNKLFTLENQPDYRALPAKVAKQTQMLVQQNFSSFFALLKKAKKGEYDKPVHLPRYLDKDGYHDWYKLYDKLSVEINPDPEELKQLFNQESPIDPINLSGLELKFEATTREQTVIEKTMSPYQLYVLDNPLWTNGLSAQNISGIIAKTIGIRKLSKSEFENAYQLAKENVYAQLRR